MKHLLLLLVVVSALFVFVNKESFAEYVPSIDG